MDFEDLFQLVKTKYPLNVTLKPEQLQVIHCLLQTKKVMAILPTGYGKFLTYMLTPLLLDEVIKQRPSLRKFYIKSRSAQVT